MRNNTIPTSAAAGQARAPAARSLFSIFPFFIDPLPLEMSLCACAVSSGGTRSLASAAGTACPPSEQWHARAFKGRSSQQTNARPRWRTNVGAVSSSGYPHRATRARASAPAWIGRAHARARRAGSVSSRFGRNHETRRTTCARRAGSVSSRFGWNDLVHRKGDVHTTAGGHHKDTGGQATRATRRCSDVSAVYRLDASKHGWTSHPCHQTGGPLLPISASGL